LRANGSRECAPDDRLREAIQLWARRKESWIASSLSLLAKTVSRPRRISVMDASCGELETIFLWNDSTRSFYFAVQQLSVLGWG
jgi:hypothetical protein